MDIQHAMHAPADWIEASSPVAEAARRMKEQDIGVLPVGERDRLVGMVTDRDLALRVVAEQRDPATTTVAEVMTPGVIYCRTHQSVEDAIHLMEQKQIRRLPVLDDSKRLVGMLSLGDIAQAVPQRLSGELTHAVAGHHA